MQQSSDVKPVLSDIQENIRDMMTSFPVASPASFKTMLEMQRKNIQALTDANQRVIRGWQTLAQRQTEMVSQFIQDNSGLAREGLRDGTAQEKLTRQADIVKSYCDRSLAHSRELGEIVRQCTIEAAEVLNQRVAASLAELGATTERC